MSDFKSAKDMISHDNVVATWTERKYVCFSLRNGFIVKLNPNETPVRGELKRGAV
jgi:hypothetical protein